MFEEEMTYNKNIVLVTWKGEGNFGTCLQSYALMIKLQELGYSVSFLQGLINDYGFKEMLLRIIRYIGLGKIVHNILHPSKSIQERKRLRFQDKYYHEVMPLSRNQECSFIKDVDCFVTGSDQIWNTYNDFNPFLFLNFAREKKRVAYASSIGTNSVKEAYKDRVKELLLKFNHIGVREKEGVKVLSELTGRDDIVQVLDPTFLLTPDDWRKMSKDAEYEMELPKDYIFCYLIGNNSWYKEQLMDVKQRYNIRNIIIIPSAETPDFSCEGATTYRNASPVEFVDLLLNAKMVCTDSFHATALSINLSVPFVEFIRFQDSDRKSQNSRIYDLLEHYGLMNRIYQKNSDLWTSSINYKPVQEILDKDREYSINYLVNAIEN